MIVFIVYAHPSDDSFTRHARDSFIEGLKAAGHSYILSDLYKMDFKTDISETEYLRESYYRGDLPVSDDVAAEHEKVNKSDAIAFIYPIFWNDAPAKLKGWFDRVWTYGFAYGEPREMKTLEKGLVMCASGNSLEKFKQSGKYNGIVATALSDRLFDRVKSKELIILDSMSRMEAEERENNWDRHLKTAYEAGYRL